MSKVLRYSFLFIGLGLLILTASVSEASAQISEILKRMDANNKSLQSLKADVTMVKYDPVLKTSDISHGSTSYLPETKKQKRYLRFEWTTKPVEQMSLSGDNYELYKPSINTVYVGKVQKSKNPAGFNALSFVSMSRDQLRTNYTVVYLGEERIKDGTATWHLQLTPKITASYKVAELWVDGNGMPRQAKTTEQNNSSTTILLSNIKKNETIKASVFVLDYDRKKVKKQKM